MEIINEYLRNFHWDLSSSSFFSFHFLQFFQHSNLIIIKFDIFPNFRLLNFPYDYLATVHELEPLVLAEADEKPSHEKYYNYCWTTNMF